MTDATMPNRLFFGRIPTASKTADEMRKDAWIHDKEIELTYLRQIVNIARATSADALSGLQAVLQAATSQSPKVTEITGENFDGDFRRK